MLKTEKVSKMKLRKALEIILITAIGVGICSGLGGYFIMLSETCDWFADMADDWADLLYSLGDPNEAQEARDTAREMRDTARESHDYGIYFIVGAVFIAIGGTGWMAWKWGKD